jgi:hypothetical protein
MITAELVALTVVEIVALVVVLALFVVLITRRLRSIADALGQVSGKIMGGDIRRIQANVCLLGAGSALLNRRLDAIASVTPVMATKAESMPSKPAQAGSQAGGFGTPQNP